MNKKSPNFNNLVKQLEILAKERDMIATVEVLEKFLLLNPSNSEERKKKVAILNLMGKVFFKLGLSHFICNKHKEALDAFARSVSLDATSASAWNWLGFEYFIFEDYDTAIEYFNISLQKNPYNTFAWDNLLVSYCLIGEQEKVEICKKRLEELKS